MARISRPGRTNFTSTPLGRVLHDFGYGAVRAARHINPDGTSGGWVALTAHVEDTAHLGPNAVVFGNARVFGNAQVLDRAVVCDNARVYDDSVVSGDAVVAENGRVNDAEVCDSARICGDAHVNGARICGYADVAGNARVLGNALITGWAQIADRAWLDGCEVGGTVVIGGMAAVHPGMVLTHDEHLSTGTHSPIPVYNRPSHQARSSA